MAKFSRDRISHLSDMIVKELVSSKACIILKSEEDVRWEIIRVFSEETRIEETVDQEVRKILSSYSRKPIEGGQEWEVLYNKTRDEVYKKRFRM